MPGGFIEPAYPVDPELAAAAITPREAVIQIRDEAYAAPFLDINVDKVELACDTTGCALIPDDGNPHNDIVPPKKNYDGSETGAKRQSFNKQVNHNKQQIDQKPMQDSHVHGH